MNDYAPPTDGRGKPSDAPQRVTIQDLRRAAQSCRDLRDPELMAEAWGCADLAGQAVPPGLKRDDVNERFQAGEVRGVAGGQGCAVADGDRSDHEVYSAASTGGAAAACDDAA